MIIIICIVIILIGWGAAFQWMLFPKQYRCLYRDHGAGACSKEAASKCKFCRENLNNS